MINLLECSNHFELPDWLQAIKCEHKYECIEDEFTTMFSRFFDVPDVLFFITPDYVLNVKKYTIWCNKCGMGNTTYSIIR